MTRRRFLRSNVRRVAINASVGRLILREFFFNRDDLGVGRFLVVLVTGHARSDGHVRRQAAQRAGPGNIDVASGALAYVFPFAAFMTEHG